MNAIATNPQALFGAQAMVLQAQAKVLVMSVIDKLAQQAADKYGEIIDLGGRPDEDDVAADVADLSWLVSSPMFRAVVALAESDAPYAGHHSALRDQVEREASYAVYDLIIRHAIYRRRVGLDVAQMAVAAR